MIKRIVPLPKTPLETFFLWGPRQAGKSFWLKAKYPNAKQINLLKSDLFAKYLAHPETLREEVLALPTKVVIFIDEIQKVPQLLDEVHLLIEDHGIVFILCGSSARKLRRSHANLLGGRASRFVMRGLSAHELGKSFDLLTMLNRGTLPRMYLSDQYRSRWRAYVADYLKDEIAAEAVTRNLPAFSEFLRLVSLSDTEIIEFQKFGSDCGVSANTIKSYFEILTDTFLGSQLNGYSEKAKRRVVTTAKFYFFDVGLVNFLAGRGPIRHKTELFGKAFEAWVHHELKTYLDYRNPECEMFYWRTTTGVEVDFVLGRNEPIAIEAKSTDNPGYSDTKNLQEFKQEFPSCTQLILVCMVKESRLTSRNVQILSPKDFIEKLWSGKIVSQ